MKTRILLLVLALLTALVISCSAYADDFSIHSGVTFGMDLDTVKQLEINAGNKTATGSPLIFWETCPFHSKNNLSVDTTLAGYSGAYISYHFDDANKLQATTYVLTVSKRANGCIDSFYNTNAELSKKYGDSDNTAKLLIENELLPCCVTRCAKIHSDTYESYSFPLSDAYTFTQPDNSIVVIYPFVLRATVINSTWEVFGIYYQSYSAEEYQSAAGTMSDDL